MFLGRNHHEATAEKQTVFNGKHTLMPTSHIFKAMVMHVLEGDSLQDFWVTEGGTIGPLT